MTAGAGRALGSLRIAARRAFAVQLRARVGALEGREMSAKAAGDLAAIPEGDTEGLAKFLGSQGAGRPREQVPVRHAHRVACGRASCAPRMALQEGLRHADARAEAARVLAAPPDPLVAQAGGFARRQTFTNASAFLAKGQATLDHPDVAGLKPLRFIVRFLRVPYNIAARGLGLAPAGLAVGLGRAEPELIAQGLLGSAVLAYTAHLAANGHVTGAEPESPTDRAAFYAEGKQPYSVRVGNDWVSYERNLGVLGLPLAAGAAWKDRFGHQGISATPDEITRAAFELGQMFEHLPMVGA
jgi:hypothetical protein